MATNLTFPADTFMFSCIKRLSLSVLHPETENLTICQANITDGLLSEGKC